jgi:hypothetical protein
MMEADHHHDLRACLAAPDRGVGGEQEIYLRSNPAIVLCLASNKGPWGCFLTQVLTTLHNPPLSTLRLTI